MNTRPMDPEHIAAFLDDRLGPAERERFLETLAEDEEARHVLREAAAIRAELASDRADDARDRKVLPLPPPRTWRQFRVPGWSAAAVLVLAVSAVVVARLGETEAYLVDRDRLGDIGTIAEPSWSALRGGAGALSEGRRDYRLGATIVQLRAAGATGNAERANFARAALADLLEDLPGSGVVMAMLEPQDSDPATELVAAVDEAAAAIRALLASDLRFGLGIWTEQLRQALRAETHAIDAGREAALAARLARRIDSADPADVELPRLLLDAQRRLADGIDDGERTELLDVIERIAQLAGG